MAMITSILKSTKPNNKALASKKMRTPMKSQAMLNGSIGRKNQVNVFYMKTKLL